MSGSGREALGNLREWSGSLFGCPEVVGNPSGMSGFGWKAIPDVRGGREAIPDVWQWLEIPSWMYGRGREALPDVREWS